MDNMLRLSYSNPAKTAVMYIVIHNNSAVSRRWSEVLTWTSKVLNRIKNNTKTMFRSPINKINEKLQGSTAVRNEALFIIWSVNWLHFKND